MFERLKPKARDDGFYRTPAVIVREALKEIRDSGDLDIVGCNGVDFEDMTCAGK